MKNQNIVFEIKYKISDEVTDVFRFYSYSFFLFKIIPWKYASAISEKTVRIIRFIQNNI